MLVIEKWPTNYTIWKQNSTPHYETPAGSLRSHYLHRPVLLTYVPGPDFNLTAQHIVDTYNGANAKTFKTESKNKEQKRVREAFLSKKL